MNIDCIVLIIILIALIIYSIIVPFMEGYNKNLSKKSITIICVCSFVILCIIISKLSSPDSPVQTAQTQNAENKQPVIGSNEWKKNLISELSNDSNILMSKKFISCGTNKNMSDNIGELNDMEYIDNSLASCKKYYHDSRRINRLIKFIKKKSNFTMKRILPRYRKIFTKNLARSLWSRDIYVSCSGAKSTILNFTGYIFASNSNIQDFQNMIQADASNFGFKKATYRWYKGEDEYTEYKLYIK
jgi:hypothetical protein